MSRRYRDLATVSAAFGWDNPSPGIHGVRFKYAIFVRPVCLHAWLGFGVADEKRFANCPGRVVQNCSVSICCFCDVGNTGDGVDS